MDKAIRIGKGNEKFANAVVRVLVKVGFRCSLDGNGENDITVLTEPAGVDVQGVYRRLSRVMVGLECVKTDIAFTEADNEFRELVDVGTVQEIREHARAHEDGIPKECLWAVMNSSNLPESLAAALFDFIQAGDEPRLVTEMERFLN
jgi:hypothetical protein